MSQWQALRRVVACVSAALAGLAGVVLMWPAMVALAAMTALLGLDAHLAVRNRRQTVAPTLLLDISLAGVACVVAGVPPVGVTMVTTYFVVLVAVLGRSTNAWPIGLYALIVGIVASLASGLFSIPEPPVERVLAAGIIAVLVFGLATIEIMRRFISSLRDRTRREEHRIRVSNAVSVASRALVAEDDARALGFALEAIREVIDAPIAFIERNVDDDGDPFAVVVESATTGTFTHDAFTPGARTTWSEVPGARTHFEGGAPFFFRVEEVLGTKMDRSGRGGALSEVDIPIIANGVWVGVVGFADAVANRHWTTEDLALIRSLADLTAAFWQRVEDLRVRDSLIGSLDGRLRYEEALAKSATSLLGERGVGVDAALEAIGVASRVDEVYITITVPAADGSPTARVCASWVQPGLTPIHPVGEVTSYAKMPAIQEAIRRGSLARTMDGNNSEMVVGIEVGEGWFGSVGFLRRRATRSWSKRDAAFLRTIADILGAYYERSETRVRLETLLSSKDRLIASVSHELRTPLTAVVGLAESLREGDLAIDAEERDQFISMIAHESREMADLVEDLLVAARSDDGTVSVFPERTDLALLAASVASHLTIPGDVDLTVEDTPSAAYADPVRVRQIIRNLLTNAMRYGGKSIRVTFASTGEGVTVDVSDDGAGIPAHDIKTIFEPFKRASNGEIAPGSVGLGLTLSKRLAELMGGSLSYVPSDGCTFRLTLPAASAAVSEAAS